MKTILLPSLFLLCLLATAVMLSASGGLADECKPGETCPTPGPTRTPTAFGAATETPEKGSGPGDMWTPAPTLTPTPYGAATQTPEKWAPLHRVVLLPMLLH